MAGCSSRSAATAFFTAVNAASTSGVGITMQLSCLHAIRGGTLPARGPRGQPWPPPSTCTVQGDRRHGAAHRPVPRNGVFEAGWPPPRPRARLRFWSAATCRRFFLAADSYFEENWGCPTDVRPAVYSADRRSSAYFSPAAVLVDVSLWRGIIICDTAPPWLRGFTAVLVRRAHRCNAKAGVRCPMMNLPGGT